MKLTAIGLIVLVLCLLSFPLLSQQTGTTQNEPEWEYFATDKTGLKWYFNKTRIKRRLSEKYGQIVEVWVKAVCDDSTKEGRQQLLNKLTVSVETNNPFALPSPSNYITVSASELGDKYINFKYRMALWQINCTKESWRNDQEYDYDVNEDLIHGIKMPQGIVLKGDEPPYYEILSNTIQETLMKLICNK